MPIDYSKYPKDWKTRIRPDILRRAKNKCEFCLVDNYELILRGKLWIKEKGVKDKYLEDVYQNMDGFVYSANDGQRLGGCYFGDLEDCSPSKQVIKVVLTIMHLDHDITNNCYSNLAAGCQRCHNRYDARNRVKNRKKNANQIELF